MTKWFFAACFLSLSLFAQEIKFVSLGSFCEVGHVLRGCEMRQAAYPFDWITSFNTEKFLEILESDFEKFLDKKYLQAVNSDPGPLLHTHYHLEFLHEGDFRGPLYKPNLKKLKTKYQRRIERFRSLSEETGKVVFIRTSFIGSTTDPHRIYYCADNLEISDEYALRLYHVLKNKFPKLDFTLLILNNTFEEKVYEEKRLLPDLIKVRSNPGIAAPLKWEIYGEYFKTLIDEINPP